VPSTCPRTSASATAATAACTSVVIASTILPSVEPRKLSPPVSQAHNVDVEAYDSRTHQAAPAVLHSLEADAHRLVPQSIHNKLDLELSKLKKLVPKPTSHDDFV